MSPLPVPGKRRPAAPDDELPPRTGRVHIAARQRGLDVTAVGRLVLHLPHLLASAVAVSAVAYVIDVLAGPPWWIPLGCWTLSGLLAFHRPCERLMARRLFGLRYPLPEEAGVLHSVWREVTARAGVDASAYQLWVEDSPDVNAMATAGHIVSVTRHSLRTLPPARLAAVLAHELGHHTRGHAWVSLLVFWYALPARLAWRALRRLVSQSERLSTGATVLLVCLAGVTVVVLVAATYGLVLLPLATPYAAAAVARRSELRADEHAADLGFAPQLIAVLAEEHDREEAARVDPEAPFERHNIVARLLASHPDVPTRLHRLRARAEGRR
ncbi:M48 family metalloprotease [Streptomyces sp. SID8381]|uniref:M48 family metalloprotease n=1 Tax=unclassified Streptomyces TaxID=2593676 RepID=UPI0003829B20|nr:MULTISPECIES: M48 family metalloprotease [unclassified Streptomyces]MYX27951.1 M48 family metalloprotease [Streptomyces sp. SID8381]